MNTFNSLELISTLQRDIEKIGQRTEEIKELDASQLNRQPVPGKWSVAQVIAHLNSYNRYYLPEIEKSLERVASGPGTTFKPGIFGNYFTNMMAPKDETVGNKMKSPKAHSPVPQLDARAVMAEFIAGQAQLLHLLERAKKADIGRIRVPISISRFIKLKLGDTFRFLIAHQQRHFLQVERTMAELGIKTLKISSSANM